MTVITTEPQDGAAEIEDGKTTEQKDQDQDGNNLKGDAAEQDSTTQTQDNKKETFLGLIKKAENILKEGNELPKDMMWTLSHIDTEAIKPKESQESQIEQKIQEAILKDRDSREFEKLQKSLPDNLTEEQAESINTVIESEIKLGRSKTEALNYALYKTGISINQPSEREKMIEANSFPRIQAKKFVPKENDSTQYFMDSLPDKYKK